MVSKSERKLLEILGWCDSGLKLGSKEENVLGKQIIKMIEEYFIGIGVMDKNGEWLDNKKGEEYCEVAEMFV